MKFLWNLRENSIGKKDKENSVIEPTANKQEKMIENSRSSLDRENSKEISRGSFDKENSKENSEIDSEEEREIIDRVLKLNQFNISNSDFQVENNGKSKIYQNLLVLAV